MTARRLVFALGALLCGFCAAPADAAITKIARADCRSGQICFYWWPTLAAPLGWRTDQSVNVALGGNGAFALIPKGFTFSNADAIIYARAVYQPKSPEPNASSPSLASFIKDDEKSFSAGRKGAAIAEAGALETADHQALQTRTFTLPADQIFERVAYGKEGDFYLVFTQR